MESAEEGGEEVEVEIFRGISGCEDKGWIEREEMGSERRRIDESVRSSAALSLRRGRVLRCLCYCSSRRVSRWRRLNDEQEVSR